MPRRIRFIFGQTEESGPWDDMVAYVAHEETVRFGFRLRYSERQRRHGGEHGAGCLHGHHGSTPWRGENAIDRAMEQLPAESGPFAAAYRALFYSFAKLFLHSFTIIIHC